MRSLDPDEAELWARVAATIRPLSRQGIATEQQATAPALRQRSPPPSKRTATAPPVPSAAPGNTLDGSWDRKLKSGAVQPDRILDLHGLSLDAAWGAIDSALERCIQAGDRVLLLITGHARPGQPPVQRGRIRAAVHDWLAVSRHASRIAAVRGAHRRHGGGGSLYIVLRRG